MIKSRRPLQQDVTKYMVYVHTLSYWESPKGPKEREFDKKISWLGNFMTELQEDGTMRTRGGGDVQEAPAAGRDHGVCDEVAHPVRQGELRGPLV